MGFREIILKSGTKLLLGKDSKSNDKLMEQFEGKSNTIFHTSAPGSPFCVIEDLKFSGKDKKMAGIACAKYSQAWRDTKGDVKVNVFTGKEISKRKGMKIGTWNVQKSKTIKIKKKQIKKFENDARTDSTR
jgi:predicted ribosome quality control (RQC) complex YloA/Tae2 family protein